MVHLPLSSMKAVKVIAGIVLAFIAFGIWASIMSAITAFIGSSVWAQTHAQTSGEVVDVIHILSLIAGLYIFAKVYSWINPSKRKHKSF